MPDVRWADVGGHEDAKRAILETVQLPLQQPALFTAGMSLIDTLDGILMMCVG